VEWLSVLENKEPRVGMSMNKPQWLDGNIKKNSPETKNSGEPRILKWKIPFHLRDLLPSRGRGILGRVPKAVAFGRRIILRTCLTGGPIGLPSGFTSSMVKKKLSTFEFLTFFLFWPCSSVPFIGLYFPLDIDLASFS